VCSFDKLIYFSILLTYSISTVYYYTNIYLNYLLQYNIRLSIQLSTCYYIILIHKSYTVDGPKCVLLVYRAVSNITPPQPIQFQESSCCCACVAPMLLHNPYPPTLFISGSNTLLCMCSANNHYIIK